MKFEFLHICCLAVLCMCVFMCFLVSFCRFYFYFRKCILFYNFCWLVHIVLKQLDNNRIFTHTSVEGPKFCMFILRAKSRERESWLTCNKNLKIHFWLYQMPFSSPSTTNTSSTHTHAYIKCTHEKLLSFLFSFYLALTCMRTHTFKYILVTNIGELNT